MIVRCCLLVQVALLVECSLLLVCWVFVVSWLGRYSLVALGGGWVFLLVFCVDVCSAVSCSWCCLLFVFAGWLLVCSLCVVGVGCVVVGLFVIVCWRCGVCVSWLLWGLFVIGCCLLLFVHSLLGVVCWFLVGSRLVHSLLVGCCFGCY